MASNPTNRKKSSNTAENAAETAPTYIPDHIPRISIKRGTLLGRASDVWQYIKSLEDFHKECFVVIHLDVRNRVTLCVTEAVGCLTGVDVHPREIFRTACMNSSASLILVHNHPSGDPSPSTQDIELTERLRKCGTLIGIQVLDHIIIGKEGFVSLAERQWN